MPELFVTEYLKYKLTKQGVAGDRFVDFQALKPLRDPKGLGTFESIRGHLLTVERWGKTLYFRSEDDPHLVLASTLGSNGDWYISKEGVELEEFQDLLEQESLGKRENCRYVLKLQSQRILCYYEHTDYGTLEFLDLPKEGSAQAYLFPRPDVIQLKNLDHITESPTAIYHRIHSQNPFPGMGACLGAEWLFRAGVNPEESVSSVLKVFGRDHLLNHLRDTILSGMKVSRELRHFRRTADLTELQGFLNVYKRDGELCSKCQTAKIQTFEGLRGGQYCPDCQPSRG